MNCLKPIILKNGLAVPCGKCDLCLSDNRNEWSIRLAVHLESCDRMPMFITLTYDNENLPYRCIDVGDGSYHTFSLKDVDECPEMRSWCSFLYPTLHRYHVSRFVKAYKRKYGLDNDSFQYFGCGEYGSSEECGHRPHYHLLFFGDTELYEDFFRDTERAFKRISDVWRFGHVHVCLAGFDGIHYVTKYCLKNDLEFLQEHAIRPFTIASKGLGMKFLDSSIGKETKKALDFLTRNRDKIISNVPDICVDGSGLDDALEYLRSYVPTFQVILSDGRKVFLPRAIRRKLVGSFEHFKDNPLWLYNHLRTLKDSLEYYRLHGDYDANHDMTHNYQLCMMRVLKIHKRLQEKKYNNKLKKL